MTIYTTLSTIRDSSPCEDGWKTLTKSLGGIRKYGSKTSLPVSHIVTSNGFDDALWVLGNACGDEGKVVCTTFACDAAERVLHLYEQKFPGDMRPRDAINAARKCVANPSEENRAAYTAAHAAAYAAALAAHAAADAAYAAAHAADAAYAAAHATHAAARAADAAYAAAHAAYAAYAAADAAYAAAHAAAEQEWQKNLLMELLK